LDPNDLRFSESFVENGRKRDPIDPDRESLEPYYRYRVIENKQFSP